MILKLCEKIENESKMLVNEVGQFNSNFRKVKPELALPKDTNMGLTTSFKFVTFLYTYKICVNIYCVKSAPIRSFSGPNKGKYGNYLPCFFYLWRIKKPYLWRY